MPKAIVVVNYNDYKTTIDFINQVKDYKIIDKIIIVDNNSSDNSVKELNKITNKNIILLKNKENKGYSYALNKGVKYLERIDIKYQVILTNPDIIIHSEDDLKVLFKSLTNDIVIVAPRVVEDNSLSRGWKLPSLKDDIIMNTFVGKNYFKNKLRYSEDHFIGNLTYVDVVSGCFFVTTVKFLKNINYLDENVFLYYEENILGKKVKDLALHEAINNNVLIVHNHAHTIDKNINRYNKYLALKKSQYYYEEKYNQASKVGLLFLRLTAKITGFFLKIKYRFK